MTCKIKSITPVGESAVWDLTVDEDHSYQAQGFISHNCTNPNLQQVGSKGGGGVKRCYVTRFDNGCLVSVDYSQIELRLAACISKDKTMLKLYRDGADIHATTMLGIYSMTHEEYAELEKTDKIKAKEMRRVAKIYNFGVCLLENCPILTEHRGWVPIQDVQTSDRVWDGGDWVSHEGVSMNGVKEVIEVDGIWCTRDHQILTEKGWAEAWQVRENTLSRPSGMFMESGQYRLSEEGSAAASSRYEPCVPAEIIGHSVATPCPTCLEAGLPNVLSAGVVNSADSEPRRSATPLSCQTLLCESAGSGAGTICSEGAITRPAQSTTTTEGAGSEFISRSEMAGSSCDMSRPSRTGTSLELSSTGSTTTETMNLEMSDSSALVPTSEIPVGPYGSSMAGSECTAESSGSYTAPSTGISTTSLPSSKQVCHLNRSLRGSAVAGVRTGRVYDLVNAGPNNRYQAGKHIVHNCYGMGPQGIVSALRKEDPPIRVTDEEAEEAFKKFHKTYRGLSKWLDLTHSVVRDQGYVDSMMGRRRRLPEVRSSDQAQVARAERQGANHIIQSTASDMTLISGIIISRALKKAKMKSVPMITVHDSIIFDCYPGEAQKVIDLAKSIMTNLPEHGWKVMGKDFKWDWLTTPIEIGIDVGYNWRDLIEIGSKDHKDQIVDTVEKALKESAYKRAIADKEDVRDDDSDLASVSDVKSNLEDDEEAA
jgi:hypothetical protein